MLAFVLDPAILKSQHTGAPIVQVFFSAIESLRADLRICGSDLALLEGECASELGKLALRLNAGAIFYNEDYEPDALSRDERVCKVLGEQGVAMHVSLDHVYFGADEIVQHDGAPYKVFTPYKRRWLEHFSMARKLPVQSRKALKEKLLDREKMFETRAAPLSEEFGFAGSEGFPTASERSAQVALRRFLRGPLRDYARNRDYPALAATSYLSPHLRAGTIGIRTCIEAAHKSEGAEAWVSELIWRDFYQMILRRFPHVSTSPFLRAAAKIAWRSAPADFAAWCEGRTGYPIVDAAMKQLNTTGWMHNRLRMIVASFLSKDLLVDWRRGELYFEQHLADADLAANNGGWQWAASTGNDAVPYFRIFNPVLQSKKFDPHGTFVKSMLPQFAPADPAIVHEPWRFPGTIANYPPPIVDHTFARERALAAYSVLKQR